MSEANNTWRTDVSGTEYEIQFEHSMTGKYSFKVDAELVGQGRQWGFGTKTEEFEVGPQRAKISLYPKYGGLGWGSSLHLDGRYVEPLRR